MRNGSTRARFEWAGGAVTDVMGMGCTGVYSVRHVGREAAGNTIRQSVAVRQSRQR